MGDFRKRTPIRRTNAPKESKYSNYKPLLRIDFNERCGYCGDHDFFSQTYYEVDHFVPKKYLKTKTPTDYSNLVYCCRACNNFKRAKWPTQDENRPHDGVKGFIDPCDASYQNQFERLSDGAIHSITKLGDWMWSALNFGNPIHRIIWSLEQLKVCIDKLKSVQFTSNEEDCIFKTLVEEYMSFEEQLKGKPNF